MDFWRDTLLCLYSEVSYPDPATWLPTPFERNCEEFTGEHRENEAGKDRDPLQLRERMRQNAV